MNWLEVLQNIGGAILWILVIDVVSIVGLISALFVSVLVDTRGAKKEERLKYKIQ